MPPGPYPAGDALAAIEAQDVRAHPSGIEELDRVLGGGIVEGAWC